MLYDLDFVFAYIDDILMASETEEKNKKYLEIVFKRRDFRGLIISLLGHIVFEEGLQPTGKMFKEI